MTKEKEKKQIIKEFSEIINKHSLENESDTPDFILAEYLYNCLIVVDNIILKREIWYRKGKPTNKNPK